MGAAEIEQAMPPRLRRGMTRFATGLLVAVAACSQPGSARAAAPSMAASTGGIAQGQLRNTEQRANSFGARGYVPSQDIPPQIAGAPIAPSQQHLTFPIATIDVVGSTVFTPGDFAPLLQGHLGRPNTLADLYSLADAIAEKYRAAGYPFTQVQVPGQHLVDGRLIIQVNEFRVDSVVFTLDGHTVPTPPPLQPVVAQIVASHPVKAATLEAAQSAAASMTNLRVATTRIQPIGQGRLELIVMLVRPNDTGIAIQPTFGTAGTDLRPNNCTFRCAPSRSPAPSLFSPRHCVPSTRTCLATWSPWRSCARLRNKSPVATARPAISVPPRRCRRRSCMTASSPSKCTT